MTDQREPKVYPSLDRPGIDRLSEKTDDRWYVNEYSIDILSVDITNGEIAHLMQTISSNTSPRASSEPVSHCYPIAFTNLCKGNGYPIYRTADFS